MNTRYRKRPVVIEAMQLIDEVSEESDLRIAEIAGWMAGNGFHEIKIVGRRPFSIDIKTLEGTMRAEPGDFIIRGVQGEFYPCKSDIFEATYERVADDERTDSVSEVRGDEAP